MALSANGFVSSWSSRWDVTDDVASVPRVAAYDSTVYLFWQECDVVCDILYMKGTHDGNDMTFDDTVNLTNDAADSFHPHAIASGNTAYVIWTSAASPGEIMFARDPDLVADAGADIDTIEGVPVTLDGSNSSVPAGETASYSWTQTAGPSVTLSGSSTATPSFTAPDVSATTVLTFELTVVGASGSVQDSVNVSINDMTGILNLSDNSGSSFLPSMVNSGTNVYVAWYDDDGGNFDILFTRSTDSGETFSAPVNLSNDSTDSVIPFVAAVGNEVYVVWEDHTSGTNHEILFRKSVDTGGAFGPVRNLSNDSAFSTVPHMFAIGSNVYVTWQSEVGSEYDVFFSRSTDSGSVFSAPANISSNAGSSELPVVSASGSNVYLTWADDTPGNFDIFYARSTDSGATFGTPVNFSGNTGVSDWPWVSSIGSNVYLAWQDDTTGNAEIMFSVSTDSGATFDTPVNLSSNSGASLDPFVVSTADRLVVAWDDASSPADILYRDSLDDGITFSATANVSNNSGNSFVPQAAITDDSIFFVWEETMLGHPEIFFKQVSINSLPVANAGPDQTVDEGSLVTLNGSASSDPDDDSLTFSWTQTAGPAVVLSSASAASPTFTAPTIASSVTLTFQLVVNDGIASSAPDTVNVIVNDRKGSLTIRKVFQGTNLLLEGAQFTITPNPFTLTSSLVVQDDSPQDANSIDGIILLNNVEFGTFAIEETQEPSGFVKIVRTLTATVHSTQTSPVIIFENIPQEQPVVQQVPIPSPDLTSVEFNNFVLKGASVNNVPVLTVNDLPQGLLVPPTQLATLPAVSFTATAPENSSLQDLRSAYTIPTYAAPEANLAAGNVYIIPPLVINQQGSANKFVLTPVLEKTQPGMTLLVDNLTPTASGSAQLKNVEMTFTNAGSVNNAAFSFSITDTVPPGTPPPPTSILETSALFLTVDFAGDFAGTNFSSAAAFQGSPKVRVLVDRDIDIVKLVDGCPDVSLSFFNESTNQWVTVKKPTRLLSFDNAESCGYEVEPEHWSKFAIGGVKITANVLQSIIPSSSGGGFAQAASSGSKPVNSGSNVNTSVSVGGKTIGLSFANVQAAGNVRIDVSTPSQMSSIFSSISAGTGKFTIASGQGVTSYATFGTMYNIDASAVTFVGPIDIVIPYDPSLFPPFTTESDLRLVHYTGSTWEDVTVSVDTESKTIKARLNSLSPVATAVIDDGTFDNSYFISNPMKKVSIVSAKPASVEPWGTVLSATVKNIQRTNQDYAVIIQVLDGQGITQHVHISTGTLARGAEKEVSDPVNLDSGNYTVVVMVWNSADDTPWPLCDFVKSSLRI